MSKQNDPEAQLLREAEDLKFQARHEEALELLGKILKDDPGNLDALEEVADNELSLGRYDRAEKAASQVLAADLESCNAHYIVGFVASHDEKWDVSVKELKAANTCEPNDPEILRCLGWSLFSGGNTVEGLVTLERALNLEQDNPLTLSDLGVAYLGLKNFRKAIALFKRALDIDPSSDRARECLRMAERIAQKTV